MAFVSIEELPDIGGQFGLNVVNRLIDQPEGDFGGDRLALPVGGMDGVGAYFTRLVAVGIGSDFNLQKVLFRGNDDPEDSVLGPGTRQKIV